MKTIRFVFLMALALSLVGCAVLTSPAKQDRLNLEVGDNAYWFAYDASRRGTILIVDDPNAKEYRRIRMCAEPAPDIAFNVISKMENSLNYKGLEDTAKAELTANVVKLAERTQMVMFLRESMFRLCEISINTGISQKEVETLYRDILNIALHLGSEKAFDLDADKMRLEFQIKLANIQNEIELAKAKQLEADERIRTAKSAEETKKAEADKLNAEVEIKKAEIEKLRLQADLLKAASEASKKAEVVSEQTKKVESEIKKDLKQQELFK